MVSHLSSCAAAAALLTALCFTLSSTTPMDCPEPNVVWTTSPSNMTVVEGTNVSFSCLLNDAVFAGFAPEDIRPFPEWEYMIVNESTHLTVNTIDPEKKNLRFSLTLEGGLLAHITITNVEALHGGRYRCRITLPCGMVNSEEAVLRVTGEPEINLNNNSLSVDTLSNLELTGTIAGFPFPEVEHLRREGPGGFLPFEIKEHPRFTYSFDNESARFVFRIQGVLRKDSGEYMIKATNSEGYANQSFTIIINGPDPPVVSLTPGPQVVSSFQDRVNVLCSIQAAAYEYSNAVSIEWRDTMNNMVLPTGRVFYTDHRNGSVSLTIDSLDTTLVGAYTCNAMNERGQDMDAITVFGPPPPPVDPVIMIISEGVLITWKRPSTDVVITSYAIAVYMARTDTVLGNALVNVLADQMQVNYTFSDLEPGSYEVGITSNAGGKSGLVSERSTFVVNVVDVVIENSFPLVIVVVAASVAVAVLLFLVVGVAVGLYCYCSCKARRNKNTHQQTWGSEENKLNQHQPAPVVQNTYTALSLQDSSELPPSPLSPMSSSIDPKWEFPRENIQLSDVLAEGQFTVLYKGIARNLSDKPCEVAVKSLKEDATEDDLKALIYEMDVLSGIEEHPSIVSLIRVCSVGKPLYMVMEYMCHGDLLGFLRSCRGHHGMYTISPGNPYQPPSLQLCSRDLLNMATKIANGMRYLADRKIVHRALCTRNILVGSGMDVKIYNVGSFDLALEQSKDGGAGSMVKWMAPETLYDGTNTTYSDVWSFGVTLWELVTVGGTPYGEVLPEDLYTQLQGGMRMQCPTHCAQEVYDIMSACWQKNPTDRPHFAIIHENLDELVMSKLNYLDLRSYDGQAYSQFADEAAPLSTAL